MIRWAARMPFRMQLTLWWALAFGLLLAVANVAIYAAFDVYLRRDLDRKVRTVAAAELASSTDGAGIHLHPLPKEALAEGEFADTFVQILSVDGTVRLASPAIRDLPALVGHEQVQAALDGRAPLVSLGRRRTARPRGRASNGDRWPALRGDGGSLPRWHRRPSLSAGVGARARVGGGSRDDRRARLLAGVEGAGAGRRDLAARRTDRARRFRRAGWIRRSGWTRSAR